VRSDAPKQLTISGSSHKTYSPLNSICASVLSQKFVVIVVASATLRVMRTERTLYPKVISGGDIRLTCAIGVWLK